MAAVRGAVVPALSRRPLVVARQDVDAGVPAPSGFWSGVGGIFTSGPAPVAALDHRSADVVPFHELGWQVYNQYWIPNNGNNCPPNRKP